MTPLDFEPTPRLLERLRGELSAAFDPGRPTTVARAPGRLDVMGGIADYAGSVVCEMPLDVAAGVAVQGREDDRVGVFSFNLLDDHRPFRLELPAAAVGRPLEELRRDLAEPGRRWAGYMVGCLAVLREAGLVGDVGGLNVAVLSTVPVGAGVSSSAAIEVATMNALAAHLGVDFDDPMRLPALCQRAENHVVGAPCGIMDQAASHLGRAGRMLRMRCQPHELLEPLDFPPGVKAVGIDTNVEHSVGGGAYGRTRAAMFMGHVLILAEMRRLADEAGKRLNGDPTGGYLANLDPADYKAIFRPALPEAVLGRHFLEQHGGHGDAATAVDPDATYRVQAACDHHVLDAQRVRRFCDFLGRIEEHGRDKALRSAGHLMYASHKSYRDNANLGHPAADLIVDLVKEREPAGLYGARITGGGGGGTVAVLMDDAPRAAEAVAEVAAEYARRTGRRPRVLDGTSPGAVHVGTGVVGAG